MTKILTPAEIEANLDNRTVATKRANDEAMSRVLGLMTTCGARATAVGGGITRNAPKHQLEVAMRINSVDIFLRANAAYLHNPQNLVGVPKYADQLDMIVVVVPSNPGQGASKTDFYFIPRSEFLGRKAFVLTEFRKYLYKDIETMFWIASGKVAEWEAQQTLAVSSMVGKKVTRRTANKLIREFQKTSNATADALLKMSINNED